VKQALFRGWIVLCVASLSAAASADTSDCSAANYNQALARRDVCVKARDVAPAKAAATLKDPAQHLDQVPGALRLLGEQASADEDLDPVFRAQFIQELDKALSRKEAKPVTSFEVDASEINGCGCSHVIGTMSARPICLRVAGTSASTNECRLVALHVVAFEGSEDGVKRAVRHEAYADLAMDGLDALNASGRKQAHHGVAESLRTWHRYRRGLFQFPWELAFNGWLERKAPSGRACPKGDGLGPCPVQYILGHPMAALGVQLNNQRDPGKVERVAAATLAIEGVGVVFYNKSFRHYFGAACAVGFDNLVFEDPRVGPTLHLTRFVNVGYLISVRGEYKGDGTVLIAGDLAGWARDLASD
jgi:hypothetical protein